MKPQVPAIVGLTKEEASAKLKSAGFFMRTIREDDETFAVTMEIRSDRVNVEIESGKVVQASIG